MTETELKELITLRNIKSRLVESRDWHKTEMQSSTPFVLSADEHAKHWQELNRILEGPESL
jgi:hypothetical protein